MTAAPTPSFEETYARLKTAYLDRLGTNLADIKKAVVFSQHNPVQAVDLQKAQTMAHGLAGSGATFGFPEITQYGRALETFVDKILKFIGEGDVVDDDLLMYQKYMNDLADICEKARTLAAMPESDLDLAAPLTPAAPLDGRKRLNVMMIDDDRNLASLVSLKLIQRNFGVMTAFSGTEAFELMKKRRPDIIILDVNMPGVSGHDVLRNIKQNPEYASIPVLMLTASAKQQDVVGALHSGALDYIIKPIDINDLAVRVERLRRTLSRTVLIADNDQLILTLLNHKFQSRGLNVLLADNGTSAWQDIQKHRPDMVILDIRMPGMDGLSILRAMRKNDDTKNIPVIILSASKDQNDIDAAKAVDVSDYIDKPFLADNLLSRCMKVLNSEAAA